MKRWSVLIAVGLFSLFLFWYVRLAETFTSLDIEPVDPPTTPITKQVSNPEPIVAPKPIAKVVPKDTNAQIQPEDFVMPDSFDDMKYYDAFIEAFNRDEHDKAINFANNLLKIPKSYASNWWYGNVTHSVNIVLGKIYLKRGKMQKAENYLMQSIAKKYTVNTHNRMYSPQLSSFGPDRSLAFDLLKKGSLEVVQAYFKESKSFWATGMDTGRLDEIIGELQDIKERRDPRGPGAEKGRLEYDERQDPFTPANYIYRFSGR